MWFQTSCRLQLHHREACRRHFCFGECGPFLHVVCVVCVDLLAAMTPWLLVKSWGLPVEMPVDWLYFHFGVRVCPQSHIYVWGWRLMSVGSEVKRQRKTLLQNHNLWPCRLFFQEFNGQGPRLKFEQEDGQTDGRKWPKTKSRATATRPVLRHRRQASKV